MAERLMPRIPIKNAITGTYEWAILLEEVDAEQASIFQKTWSDSHGTVVRRLEEYGADIPEHFAWDWGRKLEDPPSEPIRCMAIVQGGLCQGMLLLSLEGRPSQRDQSAGMTLYVEYLQSAPWNLFRQGGQPAYTGVGTSLIGCAIRVSQSLGFQGALSLHSLSQSRSFYQKIGFDDLGPDVTEDGLHLMELAAEKAAILLQEEAAR